MSSIFRNSKREDMYVRKKQSMNILRIIQKVLVEVVSYRSSKMNITKRTGNIVFIISYIILLIDFIVFFFVIMQYVRKKMSNNTYGSLGLRIATLNHCFGKSVKTDTLFINLYDYWTNFHNENKKFYFWHSHLMWKLEMYIRKKWSKDLPKVNIVFNKYKEGDFWMNFTLRNILSYLKIGKKNAKFITCMKNDI